MAQNTKDAGESLLPCPFCGDTEFRVETGDVQPDNYHTGSVVCVSCDARGPEPEEWLGSKGEASTAARECWNRRAARAPAETALVAWQVRRADGRIDGAPIQWENCTKELYDATLSTGRYAGYENGPRCEVRALYAQPASPTAEQADAVRVDVGPNLEGLRDKLLTPRVVERTSDGWLYHPDYPTCDEGTRADKLLEAFSIEPAFVAMESDYPDFADRWHEEGLSDCSEWSPTPPTGDGWVLLEIYDTEDGPYAMFGRDWYAAEQARKKEHTRRLSEAVRRARIDRAASSTGDRA